MTSLEALIRVKEGGAFETISSNMPKAVAPMADALLSSVVRQRSPEPAVYRLELSLPEASVTDPRDRKIALRKVAGPDDAVAVVTVRRDGEHGVTVTKVEASEGGLDKKLTGERLRAALSEVAAMTGNEIPVGETRRIEVVLGAAQ